MVPQLVKDFFGFEDRQNRLNQHGRFDRALAALPSACLRVHKDIIPQVALPGGSPVSAGRNKDRSRFRRRPGHCGRSRDRSRIARPGLACHQPGSWTFIEVPAARPHHQCGGLIIELVEAAIGIGEGDAAIDGIAQIDLPI